MAKTETYEDLLAAEELNREKLAPLRRARFAELGAQRDAIDAQLAPLYAELERDDITKARDAELREQIKAIKAPMFDIDVERAKLSRALADEKTGIAKTGE